MPRRTGKSKKRQLHTLFDRRQEGRRAARGLLEEKLGQAVEDHFPPLKLVRTIIKDAKAAKSVFDAVLHELGHKHGAHKTFHSMPGFRRRGRKRRGGRGRKRRTSYKRKRRTSYRRSRKRRKTRVSRSLRLYPGGFPKTHKVKLRALQQCTIFTPAGQWGYVAFFPASCSDPFNQFRASSVVVGSHLRLGFTHKDGVAILPRPQPYGWDQWTLTADAGAENPAGPQYQTAKVLGSKHTITFVQGSNSTTDSSQFLAGWSTRLYNDVVASDQKKLPSFSDSYAHILSTEISDWINNKVVNRPSVLKHVGNGVPLLAGGQSYSFTYSHKKTRRHMRKMGFEMPENDQYVFAHAGVPEFNPVAMFMIGDVAGSTTEIKLNCFVEIEYTIQLSTREANRESQIIA